MNDNAGLKPPRFETRKAMLIAGLSEHHSYKEMDTATVGIPAQWSRLSPHLGTIAGQVGPDSYGVCYDMSGSDGFRYLCGVEVTDPSRAPDGFAPLTLPARKYAVFAHRGHVSEIRGTVDAIWRTWLPKSGHEIAEASDFFFERYGEAFDPESGRGDIEIWLPIKA